jgi:hypothetical protein
MTYISDAQIYFTVSSTVVVEHVHNLIVGVNDSLAILFQVDVLVHEPGNKSTLSTLRLTEQHHFVLRLLLRHLK